MDEQIEREKWNEVEKRLLAVADGEVNWPVYDKAGQKQDQLPSPRRPRCGCTRWSCC